MCRVCIERIRSADFSKKYSLHACSSILGFTGWHREKLVDFYNFSGIKLCVCKKKKKKEEESLLKGEGGLKGKGAFETAK